MDHPPLRKLVWVGASKKEFLRLGRDVTYDFGFRLSRVQAGQDALGEKLLNEGLLKGLGIRELRLDYDRDTYRVVYTVKLKSAVYVLHAFKKKSRFGISTPIHDLQVVRQRYLQAAELDAAAQSRGAREQP